MHDLKAESSNIYVYMCAMVIVLPLTACASVAKQLSADDFSRMLLLCLMISDSHANGARVLPF